MKNRLAKRRLDRGSHCMAVTMTLPIALVQRIDAYAMRSGRTRSYVVAKILGTAAPLVTSKALLGSSEPASDQGRSRMQVTSHEQVGSTRPGAISTPRSLTSDATSHVENGRIHLEENR